MVFDLFGGIFDDVKSFGHEVGSVFDNGLQALGANPLSSDDDIFASGSSGRSNISAPQTDLNAGTTNQTASHRSSATASRATNSVDLKSFEAEWISRAKRFVDLGKVEIE